MGQNQTFAMQTVMSALPPIANKHPRDWIGMQIKANAARTILFIAPRPDQVLIWIELDYGPMGRGDAIGLH